MKITRLTIGSAIGALALSALLAGGAQAVTIAGWDFSQYLGDSALTIDSGFTPVSTLSANYSNLDPTGNAGAESALFGRMYMNGQFGSGVVVADLSGTEAFIPTAGSLSSNLNAPIAGGGALPFDSFNQLQLEGQEFANLLGMTAQQAVQIVFGATLDSVPQFGTNWSLTFGGRTFSGSSSLGVEYSTNGADYTALAPAGLTTNDTLFNLPLTQAPSDSLFVRLSFSTANGQPIIDNLSINAIPAIPEPGTALLLLAGLVGTAAASRVRPRA